VLVAPPLLWKEGGGGTYFGWGSASVPGRLSDCEDIIPVSYIATLMMENFSKLNLNRQPHEISKPKFFSPIPPPAKFKMHQRYTYTHTHQRHMQKNHLIYKIYNFHTFFSKFDFS